MPRLIRNRAIANDRYTLLRDAASLADVPDGVPVLVPLALWLDRRSALIARGETGVWLAPADHPAAVADDVDRLPVIAIDFPQFTDGRGYSHARLLRERYHYAGELRAIGDIQRDQLYYLGQCGFDAFLIPDGRHADAARVSGPAGAAGPAVAGHNPVRREVDVVPSRTSWTDGNKWR